MDRKGSNQRQKDLNRCHLTCLPDWGPPCFPVVLTVGCNQDDMISDASTPGGVESIIINPWSCSLAVKPDGTDSMCDDAFAWRMCDVHIWHLPLSVVAPCKESGGQHLALAMSVKTAVLSRNCQCLSSTMAVEVMCDYGGACVQSSCWRKMLSFTGAGGMECSVLHWETHCVIVLIGGDCLN